MPHVITQRELNRATLARQLLLSRVDKPIIDTVEHLCGLQAQTTTTWYAGLWNRLTDFQPSSVSELLADRTLVRVALMRSTIHLVSVADCLAWRPLVEPVIVRSTNGAFAKKVAGLDLTEAVAFGRTLLEAKPMTFSELGKRMQGRWPEYDAAAMAQMVRAHAALIQIPPRGLWGQSGQAVHTTVESWLGKSVTTTPSPDDLVLRYLAAFGPASIMDAQAWSGLTKLREVFDRLRPQLITLRAEDGRELFDLPDAPRPHGDTPAPVRLMYDYDNLFLSHKDRSRFFADDRLKELWLGTMFAYGTFLVDGVARGAWRVADGNLIIYAMYGMPSATIQEQLTAEGHQLLDFLNDHSPGMRDVRITTDEPPR